MKHSTMSDWVYRLLLFAFPASMRRQFGADMAQQFRDLRREARDEGASVTQIWMLAVWDLAKHASAERARQLSNFMRRKRTRESPQPGAGVLSRPHDRLSRSTSPGILMSHVLRDIRQAGRGLIRRPGFTVVAVLTLGFGIGANTAVFSVLNSVILRPLDYHEPDRLVRLYQTQVSNPGGRQWVSGAAFLDYREMVDAFESLAAIYNYRELGFTLGGTGTPQRATMYPVSADFFYVYHVHPIIGRTFRREEERSSAHVTVLGHRLWLAQWGGDRGIIGQSVVLDGIPYEIVGVLPDDFVDAVGGDVDLWIPLELQDQNATENRGNHYLSVVGRLRTGVSFAQAQAQLNAVGESLAEVEGEWRATIVPLHDDVVGTSSTTLYVLMGAAGLVLLIACVNVANLFLARNVSRQRELAIRSAMGSGRLRLIQQLLMESLAVAVVGGIAGLLLAYWGVTALLALIPDSLPRAREVAPDSVLLLFALGVTLFTALLFGLVPALQLTNPNLDQSLRDTTRTSTGGIRSGRLRSVLVTCQVTLALVLLIGAGLLMKSFLRLQSGNIGIAPQHVMTFEIHLPQELYPPERRIAFHEDFQQRMEATPGVLAAGAVSWLPVSGIYNSWTFSYLSAEGEVLRHAGAADFRVIEGSYFEALKIPLIHGRLFERTDNAEAEPVAIINQTLADRYYAGRDPLGQPFAPGGSRWRIVGVVQDVGTDLRGQFVPKVYLPHAQFADDRPWALTQVIATSDARPDLLDVARRELASIDAGLVIHNVQSMDSVVAAAMAREQFTLLLMTIFAAVALTLAVVGIYGVLAYSVSQQTREIGIRMALGADMRAVRWAVLRHATLLGGIGISAGLLGAFALSRVLQSLLFQVSARDPVTFTAVPLGLAAAALIAAYLPARRATRVDPTEAIRAE
ncbi:MAG: ABC transporter permease [Gemmatimonadota bacterium]|nr:MAG: ABC transporter permease [Gemmatimonadota bacterium]